jgi:hypothetical protein
MDNKALADFIRTELSKVTSAINRLVLKMDTPREQNKTTISPQHTPEEESHTTEGKMPTSAEVKPAPSNGDQPERPWYKTMGGWKTLLECIAIPCAKQGTDPGIARQKAAEVFTGLRFHDLRHQAITELAERGSSDATIMALAGHMSREMLEHYSHVRMQAKRAAVDGLATGLMHQSAVEDEAPTSRLQ